jgi:hypothetical protein
MRRRILAVAALFATVALVGLSTSSAYALPGVSFAERCSDCHHGAGTNPVATLVSNDGTTATYNVTGNGLEWAVFSGATRLAGQPGTTGQFSVLVGGTYTLFDVFAYPGPLGQTTVSPTSPTAQFTIMASAGPNGRISPGSIMVDSGANATFTITADPGFHVADVLVDGTSVGALTSFTFTDVTTNRTISASFAMDVLTTYTITPSSGVNGSVSPSVPQVVVQGSDVPFMIHADPGFHISDVLVDSVSVGPVGSYTFTNVQADHTISASFAADQVGMFTITPSAGANGAISPAMAQTVAAGASLTVTITPDPGFHIESVSVDGVVIPTPAGGVFRFTNIQADHTIMATFSNDVDHPMATACSLRVDHSRIRHGQSVRLTSTLSNAVPPAAFFGTPVRYEIRRPGSGTYVLLATRAVSLTGTSSVTVRLTRRGSYRFRVRFLGTDEFSRSTSPSRMVVVR